jgi:flagellar motility protein MotE (MotC chaperone)
MRSHIPTPLPSDDDDDDSLPSPVAVKTEPASPRPSSTATTFTFNLSSTLPTTFPYTALLNTTQSISPSQLVLTDFVTSKRRSESPASSSNDSSSPPPSGDHPPPSKKTKRKARTEEEKEARALERTMRNRRAAQESRDRKKRQFESLEEENKRLQEENAKMKARIEQLESQQFQLVSTHHSATLGDVLGAAATVGGAMEVDSPASEAVSEVKEEEEESCLEATFHPAVMESVLDQQCLSSNSLSSTSPPLSTTTTIPSRLSRTLPTSSTITLLLISLILLSVLIRIYMKEEHSPLPAYLLKMMVLPSSAPATFNSLNTGSLFTGAETGCAYVVSSRVGLERGCFPWSVGSLDGLMGDRTGLTGERGHGDGKQGCFG